MKVYMAILATILVLLAGIVVGTYVMGPQCESSSGLTHNIGLDACQ